MRILLSGRNRKAVAKGKSFAVRMDMLAGKLHEQGDEFEEVRQLSSWRFLFITVFMIDCIILGLVKGSTGWKTGNHRAGETKARYF